MSNLLDETMEFDILDGFDESVENAAIIEEISRMAAQIQESLKAGLAPLAAQVDRAIKNCVTDKKQLDRLFDSLLDYTQLEEGLAVFKRLCKYCQPLYPQLTADYINIYRDLYDPDFA